ncbi:phage tail protein, partial [Salmonella enterica]|nr:phage tail protein [Salmonella enterica]
MTYAALLGHLLPPVSYDPNAPRLSAELHAEGAQFTRVEQSAGSVTGGITPLFAQAL